MTLIEMEGFLRGKCIPRDMLVNESNAQYLLRKLTELQKDNETLRAMMREVEIQRDALVAENAGLKKCIPTIGNMVEPQYRSENGNKNRRSTLVERFKRIIDKSSLHGNEKVFLKQNLLNILHEHSNLYECRYLYKRKTTATDAAIAEIGAKAVEDAAMGFHEKAYAAFEDSEEYDLYIRAELLQFANKLRGGGV